MLTPSMVNVEGVARLAEFACKAEEMAMPSNEMDATCVLTAKPITVTTALWVPCDPGNTVHVKTVSESQKDSSQAL